VQIRIISEADSKVWMKEDRIVVFMTIYVPEVILQGLFIVLRSILSTISKGFIFIIKCILGGKIMRNSKLQLMTKIGVLSALSFMIMFLEFPIPFFPPYLKIDLSDIPAIIGGFAFGPLAGVAIELIKNLLHLITKTETGGIGELANFLTGASFVIVSSLIYFKNKNKKSAIIGLAVGTLVMTAVMCLANYFILLPFYLGTAPSPDTLGLIWSTTLPFNLIKGVIVSIISVLLYKSLSPILHKK
jgi:riboflavin transporter